MNIKKDELLLLRNALNHYIKHQLGTHHPDMGKYEDILKEIENCLGNYPICRIV